MSHISYSFVLPMYNEEKGIRKTVVELSEIAKELSPLYEIIIVDDASSDKSPFIIDKLAKKDMHIRTIRLEKNTKFGGALRRGLYEARNEIVIYLDSDLPVDINDIKNALVLIKQCDIVTAYSTEEKGESFKRMIISRVYNFLIQSLFRTDIKDINSGFKIYRRKVFESIKVCSNSPFIDVEIFVESIKKGFIIKQYPVIFKKRKIGMEDLMDVVFS